MWSTSIYVYLVLKSYLPHKNINFSEGKEEIMNKVKIFVCLCLFRSSPDVNSGILDPTNPTPMEIRYEFSIYALLNIPPVPAMAFNLPKTLLLYLYLLLLYL